MPTPNPHAWSTIVGRLFHIAALAIAVAALGHAVLP
jgi:hypothetical protein